MGIFSFFRRKPKLKKPIKGDSIKGSLRSSIEYMANTLEQDKYPEKHIVMLVSDIDKSKEDHGVSGFIEMNAAYIRASDASLCDMLMTTGMKDKVFAQAIVTVSHALMYHKPELQEFANSIDEEVQEGIRNGDLKPRRGDKRKLFENLGKGMKGINLNDLMNASEADIDKMIGDMLTEDDEDERDD